MSTKKATSHRLSSLYNLVVGKCFFLGTWQSLLYVSSAYYTENFPIIVPKIMYYLKL